MMSTSGLFEQILRAAITEVREKAVPVFTFAFYHDHESRAVEVCVDTEENSRQSVRSMNEYSMRYFFEAVNDGDLKTATLWQANVGRSFSLGDFALVNLARTNLGELHVGKDFYVEMVRALIAVQSEVAALAPDPDRLVFACSGENEEVAYAWSLCRGV